MAAPISMYASSGIRTESNVNLVRKSILFRDSQEMGHRGARGAQTHTAASDSCRDTTGNEAGPYLNLF